MSKLIKAKIDVTKIPRDKIYIGEKGKYVSIDIWINDDPDKYGNDCSLNISQSKEESESKTPKIYIGNGNTKFGFAKSPPPQDNHNQAKSNGYAPDNADNIPF